MCSNRIPSPSLFVLSRIKYSTVIANSLCVFTISKSRCSQKHIAYPPPPPPCAEDPPPPPVRMTPRYVVLDTTADLVLEARFRGNFYAHDWVYSEDDPTFLTGSTSLFTSANRTNVGQTYTIPAGSAALRVGYYGPFILPTVFSTIRPTPENTVIVASFGKYNLVQAVVTPSWRRFKKGLISEFPLQSKHNAIPVPMYL